MDDGETPPGNARYVLDDTIFDGEVVRRGPRAYADPEGSPEPPHPYLQDLEFLPSSRMCGTCHDVTTERERVDDEGVGMGVNFNEQRTYSEWVNSAYAVPGDDFQTCQDCHMKVVEVPASGCQEHENLGYFYDDFRRHLIVGANSQALEIIAANSPGANVGAINAVIEYADEFIAEAATLEVEFPDAVDLDAGIAMIPVRVTNETGHKLPTGYSEGRVMWLEVTASYGGELVWSSGNWDGAAIEDDEQLRTYEGVGRALGRRDAQSPAAQRLLARGHPDPAAGPEPGSRDRSRWRSLPAAARRHLAPLRRLQLQLRADQCRRSDPR